MALGPIDYTVNTANPIASLLGGLQGGLQIQGIRQEQAQRQQLADAQALKLAADQQKAQIESAAMERQQRYMDEFDRMGVDGFDADRANFLSMFMPKDTAQAIREGAAAMTTSQRQKALGEMTDVAAAMISGNLDVAREKLRIKAEGYRNSGKEDQAMQMDAFLKGLEDDDPRDVILGITGIMSQFEGGKDAIDSLGKVQMQPIERREGEAKATEAEIKAKNAPLQLAADLGLTRAQTNQAMAMGNKLGAETQKILMDMEFAKANGGIPPEEKFNQEEKLRKEYNARTAKYSDMRSTYSNIVASGADDTGAGDVALVTSFMKMLDPGSVVRETEFATARDTAGLLSRLQNAATKLKDGQFLDKGQRAAFTRLAGQYMAAAQKDEKIVRDSLGRVVSSYGLNSANVFSDRQPDIGGDRTPAQSGPAGPGFRVIR